MKPLTKEKVAWQNATASVILTFVGMPIELLMGRSVHLMPRWPTLMTMAVGAALLLQLLLKRSTMTVREATWIFIINNAVIVACLWITSAYFAADTRSWTPFQAHKLSVLAVALLAPPARWAGLLTIGLFAGSGVLRFETFPSAIRDRMPLSEPWALVAFAAFAAVLLLYRLRSQKLYSDLARVHAEAVANEKIARRFLAIRDLANTPLQTLEGDAALLARMPGGEERAKRMARSLKRLREWQHLLHEDPTRPSSWADQDASFDAREVLRDDASGASHISVPHKTPEI